MLSQVGILLSTGRAGAAELVVDIHNVSLQVCLQIASVATVATLEIFQLKIKRMVKKKISSKSRLQVYLDMLLVDVVSEVRELLEAMGTSVFLLLLHIPEKISLASRKDIFRILNIFFSILKRFLQNPEKIFLPF